jgi:hypothetical protein
MSKRECREQFEELTLL